MEIEELNEEVMRLITCIKNMREKLDGMQKEIDTLKEFKRDAEYKDYRLDHDKYFGGG